MKRSVGCCFSMHGVRNFTRGVLVSHQCLHFIGLMNWSNVYSRPQPVPRSAEIIDGKLWLIACNMQCAIWVKLQVLQLTQQVPKLLHTGAAGGLQTAAAGRLLSGTQLHLRMLAPSDHPPAAQLPALRSCEGQSSAKHSDSDCQSHASLYRSSGCNTRSKWRAGHKQGKSCLCYVCQVEASLRYQAPTRQRHCSLGAPESISASPGHGDGHAHAATLGACCPSELEPQEGEPLRAQCSDLHGQTHGDKTPANLSTMSLKWCATMQAHLRHLAEEPCCRPEDVTRD